MSHHLASEASELHPYNTTRGHDHLSWAKRIMHRENGGDKTLLLIQVKSAKEALGIVDKPTNAAT